VGEEVTLSVSLTDQYENANVYFCVWPDGADTEKDAPLVKLASSNKGGKAEAKWRYIYVHDPKHPLTAKPKFVFIAKSYRCEEQRSGSIEWGDDLTIKMVNNFGEPIKNTKYKITGPDGNEENGTLGDDGKIEKKHVIPGSYKLEFVME
jgi:hypothetical protein